jgi:hypothetical protein
LSADGLENPASCALFGGILAQIELESGSVRKTILAANTSLLFPTKLQHK